MFRKIVNILNVSTHSKKKAEKEFKKSYSCGASKISKYGKDVVAIEEGQDISCYPRECSLFLYRLEVTPSACGGRDVHYKLIKGEFGPELMFAHKFPKKKGKFLGKQIGITKVAMGGIRFRQWMNPEYGCEGREECDASNYWSSLKAAIQAAAGTLEAFVWFQGEDGTGYEM